MASRIRPRGFTVWVVLLLLCGSAAAQTDDHLIKTKISCNDLTVTWNRSRDVTALSYNILFELGGDQPFTDLNYAASHGKGNFDLGQCYYQTPGGKRTKLPKEWFKQADRFEEYILYSEGSTAKWTLSNLPVGTQVELAYEIRSDRFVELLSLPLQNTWDIDTTVIHFVLDPGDSLELLFIHADDLNIEVEPDRLSAGLAPEWESHSYDGGFNASGAWVNCHVMRKNEDSKSWRDVSLTIQDWWSGINRDLPLNKLTVNEEVLLKSVPEDMSIFEEAFRYVAIYVGDHGFIPHRPKDVFNYKYGDCKDLSLTLCEMLDANGVAAYPVLVNTPARMPFYPEIPTPYQFNHCIVAYIEDQDTVYYDPTTKGYPSEVLPWSIQGAPALWLSTHVSDLMTLPVDSLPIILTRIFSGSLEADGSLRGTVELKLDSRLSSFQLPDKELSKWMVFLQKHFEEGIPSKIDSVTYDKDSRILSAAVFISRLGRAVNGKTYLVPNPFRTPAPDITDHAEGADLFLGQPFVCKDSVSIRLPSALSESVSVQKHLTADVIVSDARIEAVDSLLSASWTAGTLQDFVPASRYDELCTLLDSLNQHRSSRVILTWLP